MRILVVDDDQETCSQLARLIGGSKLPGGTPGVTCAGLASEAYALLERERFDFVVTDVGLPDGDGIEIARAADKLGTGTRIILFSGQDEIIRSLDSLGHGVYDFLPKPVDVAALIRLLRSPPADHQGGALAPEVLDVLSGDCGVIGLDDLSFLKHRNTGIIGIFSDTLAVVFRKILKLQDYPQIPLLIQGETGTGKEVLARYSHYRNPAINGPFVAFNCSNLNRELFESELFGYEKGSFTGALASGREGLLGSAAKGTLFLDEVAEIPFDLQAKLLRVIESREYFRVGGTSVQPVDARLVFATNRDLKNMVGKGQFREDLYYRLTLCEVRIPPLRERREEIVPLALFLAGQLREEFGKPVTSFERAALRVLERYPFPGNVRELKNILTKVFLFGEGKVIRAEAIREMAGAGPDRGFLEILDSAELVLPDRPFSLAALDRAIIRKTLEKFNGNKSRAAAFLGLKRDQFYGRYREAAEPDGPDTV